MAHSRNDTRTLILADSRGKGLSQKLSQVGHSLNTWIVVKKGAPTSEIIQRSQMEILSFEPTHVFVLTGLCSITAIQRPSRQVYVRNDNPHQTAAHYLKEMQTVDQLVKSMLEPKVVNVIFATITGMDICIYNKCETPTTAMQCHQEILDQSVKCVNDVIIQRNSELGFPTPWLHRLIHRNKQGKTTNSYHRLDSDGCHLTDPVLAYWAKELNNAILKIQPTAFP